MHPVTRLRLFGVLLVPSAFVVPYFSGTSLESTPQCSLVVAEEVSNCWEGMLWLVVALLGVDLLGCIYYAGKYNSLRWWGKCEKRAVRTVMWILWFYIGYCTWVYCKAVYASKLRCWSGVIVGTLLFFTMYLFMLPLWWILVNDENPAHDRYEAQEELEDNLDDTVLIKRQKARAASNPFINSIF